MACVCVAGKSGEEQVVHLHQNPRSAGESVLQRRQREEHRGRARIFTGRPHFGVPQRHVDLARPLPRHEERLQTGPPLSGIHHLALYVAAMGSLRVSFMGYEWDPL